MGKASFSSTFHVFGSSRAGSGKATIVANLAIYLHSRRFRVAVVDFHSKFQMKLRGTFPRSVQLEAFPDISELAGKNDLQRENVVLRLNTEKIGWFPSFKIRTPLELVSDPTLKNLTTQIASSFDFVLINLGDGTGEFNCLPEMKKAFVTPHLGVVCVTQPDVKSLQLIDGLIRSRPAIDHLFRESVMVLLNRCPRDLEGAGFVDPVLSQFQVMNIFNLASVMSIPDSDDFRHQLLTSFPKVTQEEGQMKYIFGSVFRNLNELLNHSTSRSDDGKEAFLPCTEPVLLQNLDSRIRLLCDSFSRRLFISRESIKTFVESNSDHVLIRMSFSRKSKPAFPRERQLDHVMSKGFSGKYLVDEFCIHYGNITDRGHAAFLVYLTTPEIVAKPVYQFDDRFH